MSVWNSKYNTEFFTSNPACNYRIDLLLKDYTGGTSTSIKLDPEVIQEWQDDDPKTPIRGCTLKIKVITGDPFYNAVNFLDFYSNEDDTWKVVLKRTDTNETLFVGYLLQDDCSDICIDYTHTFSLTFSDNLGIMKGVSLLQASEILPNFDTFTSITVQSLVGNPHEIYSADSRWGILNIGDNFTIFSGGLAGTYTVIGRGFNTIFNLYFVYTAEPVPPGFTVTDDIDYTYFGLGTTGYQSFRSIFIMLIYSTGHRLPLNVMTKLVPVGGTTDDLLRDTYVDVNSFLKNGEWMNCYDILELICLRFNACFFQAHGQWYFVRWDELYRYTTFAGATYQGNAYNADMNVSTITQNIVAFDFLGGKDMETGTMKSIVRPDLFVRETFNYQQPESLLCNANLQDLGNVIQEYISGTFLIKEYGLSSWFDGPFSPIPDRFIRITFDNDSGSRTFGQELDRNVVIVNSTGSAPQSAKSCDIALSKGDIIEFNFSYRTNVHQAGPINNVFAVSITDGTTTYYVQNNGSWATTLGFVNNIPNGGDTFDWQSVNILSNPAPINGIVNIYLAEATPNGATPSSDETLFKDLSFIITYFINDSGKIIGHIHNSEQYLNVKKNNDKEIFIDDCPRTSINGALYLSSYTSLLRDLTVIWHYPGGLGDEYPRLGQGTTQEALFTSYIPRYKFEGNLLYVNKDDKMLTPFSVFNLKTEDNQFRFVPGKITINYHANMAEVTLWEFIRNPAGIFGDQRYQYLNEFLPSITYNFNYLYENN
jgi:hypothetical protein